MLLLVYNTPSAIAVEPTLVDLPFPIGRDGFLGH